MNELRGCATARAIKIWSRERMVAEAVRYLSRRDDFYTANVRAIAGHRTFKADLETLIELSR